MNDLTARDVNSDGKAGARAIGLFCEACNGMTAVTVDDAQYKRETAKFVADGIRKGRRVENLTVGDVRSRKHAWCECTKRLRAVPEQTTEE